ncbi:hypothetical protein AQUCO_00900174v1 [Aquilegia coerulea]|uniref:Uncharacterized protein n=1 Tax=Aquilegia coerulea TaxID=218851 RepID=A0A2G5ECC5_AQUCA|nr:hypothetical protein AQUCO_00900174v1 [Aquilegia coerulea]
MQVRNMQRIQARGATDKEMRYCKIGESPISDEVAASKLKNEETERYAGKISKEEPYIIARSWSSPIPHC